MSQEVLDNSVLAAAIEALATPVFVVDEEGRYVDVIGGMSRDAGADASVVGRRLHEVLPAEVAEELLHSIRSALSGDTPQVEEYQLGSSEDGEESGRWYQARIAPIAGEPGQPRQVACVTVDITERKQLEQQCSTAAGTDPLTGLANQRRFMDILEDEVARSSRYSEPFCLLMLELDHFETIREHYGDDAADRSLRALARLIRQELRHSDVLARLEDGEFGVLLINTPLRWGLEVGERIRLRTARTPFNLPGRMLQLTVSGGVTEFRQGESPSALLWRAEEALYKSGADSDNRISVA